MRFRMKVLIKLPLVLLAIAVMGEVVTLLWNWVVPPLFVGAQAIDFPHALGLLVLCRILFGGFRGRGGWHKHRHWRRLNAAERERILEEDRP